MDPIHPSGDLHASSRKRTGNHKACAVADTDKSPGQPHIGDCKSGLRWCIRISPVFGLIRDLCQHQHLLQHQSLTTNSSHKPTAR
jgi:hypothetical protein